MADNQQSTKITLNKKSLPIITGNLKVSKSKQYIGPGHEQNQIKFKIPKNPTFKHVLYQPPKLNGSSLNPNHLSISANQNVLTSSMVTNQSTASNKNLLKEELAADQSTSKVLKSTSNQRDSKLIRPDGFSLTASPVLGVNQNISNQMPDKLNVHDQLKIDNKKRISLMKKTTLVQDLENMQATQELSALKNQQQQAKNEQNFDLGLVPIDIYTTSDYETADQIVEARGYILQERIGSGAFANVHKAWHITEQIYTACKIIELKKKKKKRLNDLKHELYVLDKMDHINIIKLYEHFLIDEKVYIFLEYASCGTLSEYVRKRGPLKENRARKWFKQICSGLYHMHSHGISHRDLVSYRKGYGVFYCTSYCGTEAYMSPEIIKKDEFGKRMYDPLSSDIWALGVCLYAMVNKAYPFNPEDKDLMVNNQLQRKWKFVKKQRSKLSDEIKDLVRNLLEPDSKRRITFLGIASHSWMNDDFENRSQPMLIQTSISTTSQTNDSNISQLTSQMAKNQNLVSKI